MWPYLLCVSCVLKPLGQGKGQEANAVGRPCQLVDRALGLEFEPSLCVRWFPSCAVLLDASFSRGDHSMFLGGYSGD